MQLGGWQDGFEVRTVASKLSTLGLNPDPAINCHPQSFTGRVTHQCVWRLLGWTLNWASRSPALLDGH